MENILFNEESNLIEYKEKLPENNIKWLKTVVSFSNTSGGTLAIGIKDITLDIVGINEERSKIEQQIVETIYQNVEPRPIINISFKNINDKDIVLIDVAKGNETPYFIKKEGLQNGCYVRYGSTDQKATNSQRMELYHTQINEAFSNKIYEKNGVLFKQEEININDFTTYLNKYSKFNREITNHKLIEWSLLKDNFNEIYATNGLMLLTHNPFNYAYVRIGIFSGYNKTNLIDDFEIKGNLITQYYKTIEFLLENLKIGYEIKIIREMKYKVPEIALREIIANAIIHRSYLEEEPIKIMLFDDRLEIFSPGTLFNGLQLEQALNGISKLRNPNICEVFHHIGIVEKWGSGLQRANQSLQDNNMSALEFNVDNIHGVSVIIKFNKIENQNIIRENEAEYLDEYNYLAKKKIFTRKDLERDLKISQNQARYLIENWTKEEKITRRGKASKTEYLVK